MRTHARALPGERAYDFKPFYRGTKISVIGAVTVSQVLAVLKDTASHMMTIDDSMDAAAFKVYPKGYTLLCLKVSCASALERGCRGDG